MPVTGYVQHASCLSHEGGPAHPERPARLEAIDRQLARSGLLDELQRHEPRCATDVELALVHRPDMLARIERAFARAPARLDEDTAVSPGSREAALRAAGGALEACDRVMSADWQCGFVAVRPPGHHAERGRPMGFCLYNNVAIAARHLREQHGLRRVAIVDFDVHHGNGTQDVFYEDGSVFYASLHQWPLYPGTGVVTERGRGEGDGTTLNVPLAPGAGDAEWVAALEQRVLPELEAFAPEFLLLSAGFDAHRLDPLASSELTEDGYRRMTRSLLEVARRTAGGRLVSVLEGGYHLEALGSSVEAHVAELHGARA